MKVLIFGASGMIGQGVLRECLLDPDVELVLSIGRSAITKRHPKLREIVSRDLMHYEDMETSLEGFDACFFCLGVSSAGLSPDAYERITYGITLAAAETLSRLNPQMTFVYVSGAGTDSSENGRVAWARVKGRTENALSRLRFKAAYMFRPAFIEAAHGEQSRTGIYRNLYKITKPVIPILRRLFPNYVATTEEIGRAMLQVAKHGASKNVLENSDIRRAAIAG